MNCLYPGGTSCAYNFAKERKTYLFENNRSHAFLNKGLPSLYGYPFKFEEYNDKRAKLLLQLHQLD